MSTNPELVAPDILVVDDMAENIELLKLLLAPKGYRIRAAYNGQEALDVVAADPPDVILLDLAMPVMDGFTVCERLKGNPETRHIPIIIITGLAEHEANLRALEAGADDFVLRPFNYVLLDARIRSSARSKALQDQVIDYQRTLEQRVSERTEQVVLTQRVTVFSLARLAESRDPETGDHLSRMRCYVDELARHLATQSSFQEVVTDEFIEQLYHSSPLHDIGKVGIPDAILLKPDKLTPDEFDIMKTHSVIGGDTLKAADQEVGQASFLAMGRDIAYYHNEQWCGRGYPCGLEGEKIPLSARLVALGDVYDALRSRRPYKEPLGHEEARVIILEGGGVNFDPDIVDAFLAVEDRFVSTHKEFPDTGQPSLIQQIVNQLAESQAESPPAEG